MNQPALTGFDWSALDPDTRVIVEETTARLHELERRTGEAIIQIGRGLADTKYRIGHGNFLNWLNAEFGWSEPTAQRFMRVAQVFENRQIDGFQPSALYALASGTVPETIRDEFIAKAEAGEPVRHKDVKRRLATVDRDTGEVVDDEPEIEAEIVDPTDPASFLPDAPADHRPTPLDPAISDSARAFSDGMVRAQAPATVAKHLADCRFRLLGAKRVLSEFSDAISEHGNTPDALNSLDQIVEESLRLHNTALSIRDQLRTGTNVRAIR